MAGYSAVIKMFFRLILWRWESIVFLKSIKFAQNLIISETKIKEIQKYICKEGNNIYQQLIHTDICK